MAKLLIYKNIKIKTLNPHNNNFLDTNTNIKKACMAPIMLPTISRARIFDKILTRFESSWR